MAHHCALITGATSGIGASFADVLPSATDLLLTGRDQARLETMKEQFSGNGRIVDTVAADLATAEGRANVIAAAESAGVDLLINNAGLGCYGAFATNAPETEREMVEVNVVTPVVLTRALLPGMIAKAKVTGQNAGVIVVSSIAGFQALPYLGTYAATKAFDLLFAEALASELSDVPVDVLALCPGATRTNFFNRAGLAKSAMPYMIDSDTVARRGLAALGKRTIEVTDPIRRIIGAPALAVRALKRAATAMVLRRMGTSR